MHIRVTSVLRLVFLTDGSGGGWHATRTSSALLCLRCACCSLCLLLCAVLLCCWCCVCAVSCQALQKKLRKFIHQGHRGYNYQYYLYLYLLLAGRCDRRTTALCVLLCVRRQEHNQGTHTPAHDQTDVHEQRQRGQRRGRGVYPRIGAISMRRRRGCAPHASPPACRTASLAAAVLSFGAYCCCCCSTLGVSAGAAVVGVEASSSPPPPAAPTAAATADEPLTLVEGSVLKWVKAADSREGHAAACLRNGLDPTTSEVLLSDEVQYCCCTTNL